MLNFFKKCGSKRKLIFQYSLEPHFFFKLFLSILFFILPFSAVTQIDDFGGIVHLDSIVVSATRQGFDVDDFIRMVRKDESFYKAFKNLHRITFEFENDLYFFDKKGNIKASYKSHTRQTSDGDCRQMEVLDEKVIGKFYKRKKKHRYYTALLYEKVFFTEGTICESAENGIHQRKRKKGIAKHIAELEKLIFSPGEKANVPLIGNKTAIFDKKMQAYYDYSIQSDLYKNEIDAYVFTAQVKPEFLKKKKNKTVIKHLRTYFDKTTFNVIARTYQLAYDGAFFDFDVKMHIELKKEKDLYFPEIIQYDGNWDVVGKKRERGRFELRVLK